MDLKHETGESQSYEGRAMNHCYPRPQLTRSAWTSLNGRWQFAIDANAEITNPSRVQFDREIIVPYAPETEASGINDTGYYKAVFYKRQVQAPKLNPGERLLLHFGAVDYKTTVTVNGATAGQHEGGYTPFSIDITDFLDTADGALQEIIVRAEDDPHDLCKPRGKQDWELNAHSIWYPRTTGIWQTVWMEAVPAAHVRNIHWTSNVERWEIGLAVMLDGPLSDNMRVSVKLTWAGKVLANDVYGLSADEAKAGELRRRINLPDGGIEDIRNRMLWAPHNPALIEAEIKLLGDDLVALDTVASYTAIRQVQIQRDRLVINDKPVKLRMVLNQGYWEHSGMTAPDDEALKRDVELIKEMGFNGVRMHQKIEDPRFLYWADKLGLLVWEEMPSAYTFSQKTVQRVTSQWMEAFDRDISHPCIIAWVPINESWGVPSLASVEAQRQFQRSLYSLTRALDPSRPVIGNDGWEMVETDIIAVHDYHHDPEVLRDRYANTAASVQHLIEKERPGDRLLTLDGMQVEGRPIMLTEFGGIKLSPDEGSWGYSSVRLPEELAAAYERLMNVVGRLPLLAGFCYTQFTDTYQEANGLLNMDRTPKFSMELISRATRS